MADIIEECPQTPKLKKLTKKETVKEEKVEKIKKSLKKKPVEPDSDSDEDVLHVVLPKKKAAPIVETVIPIPTPAIPIQIVVTAPVVSKPKSGLKLIPDLFDYIF
jgi:hypothetical protein